MIAEDIAIETTPVYFANEILGISTYGWQDKALTWFEDAVGRRAKVTIATPNGAGKDSVVIASLALWWVAMHERGRVVITSKDARQIDEQTYPALSRHRGKFPEWKFIDRYIETPTKGKIILFTTDDAGRCEGFHRETDEHGNPSPAGPLLLIANEAKSIDEAIFEAFDRCTYDALLYASSPGQKVGSFYDSHFNPALGFKALRVGLKDCPHIPADRIRDIRAKYGDNSPFTRSTLDGEFMDALGESRFDREGLKHLKDMADAGHDLAWRGVLETSIAFQRPIPLKDEGGWLWMDQEPQPGGEYLLFCDPNTCEQGEGTEERDNTACGIMRAAYIDEFKVEHKDQIVAALTWPGGVKWDSDVLAKRMKLLADYYGGCEMVVEANNFGSALMKVLQLLGAKLWKRTKIDDVNPNKEVKIVGFLTTERSREHWVQRAVTAVRDNALACRFKPAVDEFHTFVHLPSGRSEAQAGTHDDWVAAIGIALTVRCFSPLPRPVRVVSSISSGRPTYPVGHPAHGSCG